MMQQRLLLILVSLWPSIYSATTAQVGFSLPALNNVAPGSAITVPLSVSNFDSVVAIQFVVQWNPQVLSFSKILLYNLPNMDDQDFGLSQAQDSGIIRFAWEAPVSSLASGITRPDSTVIFRMRFNVTGQIGDSSALTITERQPTVFEVIKVGRPPQTIDSCIIDNGFVAIGYTVSTDEPEGNSLPVKIFPNPFSTSTNAFFDLKDAETVQVRLTDVAGRLVEEKKIWMPAGQHGMEIVSDQLQENGIYYLILRTASQSCTRTLVKF